MRTSRVLATVAVLGGCAAVVGYSASALSADHQDSPATRASPTADINDVYSWVDGDNVVLAMTIYPAAPTGALFDDRVQYVFHTSSGAGFGATSTYTDVIATFDTSTPQKISLWVGAVEYLTGDASSANGLSSADGKVKVFAGLRADPFFFNLEGFKNTVATVESLAGTLTPNDAGCPGLSGGQQTTLATELATSPDGGAPVDHFATFDGLAIVVSVNKALLTAGGPVMSVWAGTYATTSLTDAGGQ
ncbi:MAG TPA: DUF4331 family protein [Polyangiaceae bacterium]